MYVLEENCEYAKRGEPGMALSEAATASPGVARRGWRTDDWNRPLAWAGSVGFGESRSALRERLGECRSSLRTPGAPETDHYLEAGLLLDFDRSDALEFIEATARAGVTYSGVVLAGRPFGDVVSDLRAQGVEVALDDSGAVMVGLGVELYTTAPGEPEVDVECVSIRSGRERSALPSEEKQPDEAVDESVEALGDTLF
ncbi:MULTISPECIES: hypothetical protein [Streptomyces]|uniref:Uncharacterized protein n=1 Tax=Streptomyces pratisoli TaxID=3139917 RepID=A0ACC6QHM6_9ACTN|nr:hypothetical protein [Streptomyces sp. NBC_00259]